jgi:hypothetical protein
MPRGPKGEKRPADVIGNAVHVMRIARRGLTSDGHRAYLEAVEGAFGADIDYTMVAKNYGLRP